MIPMRQWVLANEWAATDESIRLRSPPGVNG